ncbi:MAG: hypothetical protein CSA84_06845 [Actinomycetales bacterium]|nr:MAG: hypothetical protein CSA84_06845 [Actinomycetales bacterium]
MNTAVAEWGTTRKWLCLATVLLGAVASSLLQTFLTVSLPTITTELDAVAWYGWVNGLYLAAATLAIPPWAILSDRVGPRVVLITGMALWALGALAVSFADSAAWLLGARTVQGIGSAAAVPASFAAITAVYQSRYGRLIGLVSAVQATATLAGGPLGGWLGTWFGWRTSMQLVAIVAAVPVVVGWFVLPDKANEPPQAKTPRLLRAPAAQRAVAQTMLLAVVAFGVATYLPLLLQSQFGLDLAHTAVSATPALLGVAIGSAIGGSMSDQRDTTVAAWLIVVAGLLLAWVPSVAAATIGSALAAAGVGVGLPSQLIAIERVATSAHAAKAAGLIQAARNIGGALGVALLGIPLQFNAAPQAGTRYAFAAMLSLALIASAVSAITGNARTDNGTRSTGPGSPTPGTDAERAAKPPHRP